MSLRALGFSRAKGVAPPGTTKWRRRGARGEAGIGGETIMLASKFSLLMVLISKELLVAGAQALPDTTRA